MLPVPRAVAVLLVLSAAPAFAQSALTISCGRCGAFEGLEINLNGHPMNAGHAGHSWHREGLSPGTHDVEIYIWKGPFKRVLLVRSDLELPDRTEVRVRAHEGRLEVFGKAPYTPPAPEPVAAQGPSRDQLDEARELLGEAMENVKEAVESNEEEESRCQGKVGGKLEVVRDALKEARRELDPSTVRRVLEKLDSANRAIERNCPPRVQRGLTKKLDRAQAKVARANQALR